MDAKTLRQTQAPLKDSYRSDPATSRTGLRARGDFRDGGVTCPVDGWAGPVRAGLHPATGGHGGDACSGDMLLQALLACAGVTLRSVATAMGIEIRGAELTARAEMDARGTLGVSREAPVGLQRVEVTADLDTDADDATLTRLADLTERYCVVAQTLAEKPRLVLRRRNGNG